MQTIRMEEMNWVDIKEAINNGFRTAVIGIGSIEQHGPHLPTLTDALTAEIFANRVASRLKSALQAPTIRVGCSDHHLDFFAISYSSSTLKAVIRDYVNSLARQGITSIVLLPSHGGNFKPLKEVVEILEQEKPGLKLVAITDLMAFFESLNDIASEFGVTKEEAGAHSGETETSIILSLAGNLVKKERFTQGYLGPMGAEESQMVFERGLTTLTENGILGDPRNATSEKGEVYVEKIVDYIVEEVSKQLS
ncbi:MAG: creatininase family protein [Candidatus Odinarchaeota archaeon]